MTDGGSTGSAGRWQAAPWRALTPAVRRGQRTYACQNYYAGHNYIVMAPLLPAPASTRRMSAAGPTTRSQFERSLALAAPVGAVADGGSQESAGRWQAAPWPTPAVQ